MSCKGFIVALVRWTLPFLLLISTGLIIIALATRHWVHDKNGNHLNEYGLWEMCEFENGDALTCTQTALITSQLKILNDKYVPGSLLTSGISCILAIICLLLFETNCARFFSHVSLCIFIIIAVVFGWASIGRFATEVSESALINLEYEWSFILACIAACILTLLIPLAFIFNKEELRTKRMVELGKDNKVIVEMDVELGGDVEHKKRSKAYEIGRHSIGANQEENVALKTYSTVNNLSNGHYKDAKVDPNSRGAKWRKINKETEGESSAGVYSSDTLHSTEGELNKLEAYLRHESLQDDGTINDAFDDTHVRIDAKTPMTFRNATPYGKQVLLEIEDKHASGFTIPDIVIDRYLPRENEHAIIVTNLDDKVEEEIDLEAGLSTQLESGVSEKQIDLNNTNVISEHSLPALSETKNVDNTLIHDNPDLNLIARIGMVLSANNKDVSEDIKDVNDDMGNIKGGEGILSETSENIKFPAFEGNSGKETVFEIANQVEMSAVEDQPISNATVELNLSLSKSVSDISATTNDMGITSDTVGKPEIIEKQEEKAASINLNVELTTNVEGMSEFSEPPEIINDSEVFTSFNPLLSEDNDKDEDKNNQIKESVDKKPSETDEDINLCGHETYEEFEASVNIGIVEFGANITPLDVEDEYFSDTSSLGSDTITDSNFDLSTSEPSSSSQNSEIPSQKLEVSNLDLGVNTYDKDEEKSIIVEDGQLSSIDAVLDTKEILGESVVGMNNANDIKCIDDIHQNVGVVADRSNFDVDTETGNIEQLAPENSIPQAEVQNSLTEVEKLNDIEYLDPKDQRKEFFIEEPAIEVEGLDGVECVPPMSISEEVDNDDSITGVHHFDIGELISPNGVIENLSGESIMRESDSNNVECIPQMEVTEEEITLGTEIETEQMPLPNLDTIADVVDIEPKALDDIETTSYSDLNISEGNVGGFDSTFSTIEDVFQPKLKVIDEEISMKDEGSTDVDISITDHTIHVEGSDFLESISVVDISQNMEEEKQILKSSEINSEILPITDENNEKDKKAEHSTCKNVAAQRSVNTMTKNSDFSTIPDEIVRLEEKARLSKLLSQFEPDGIAKRVSFKRATRKLVVNPIIAFGNKHLVDQEDPSTEVSTNISENIFENNGESSTATNLRRYSSSSEFTPPYEEDTGRSILRRKTFPDVQSFALAVDINFKDAGARKITDNISSTDNSIAVDDSLIHLSANITETVVNLDHSTTPNNSPTTDQPQADFHVELPNGNNCSPPEEKGNDVTENIQYQKDTVVNSTSAEESSLQLLSSSMETTPPAPEQVPITDTRKTLIRQETLMEKFHDMFGEGGSEIHVDRTNNAVKSENNDEDLTEIESNNEHLTSIAQDMFGEGSSAIYVDNTDNAVRFGNNYENSTKIESNNEDSTITTINADPSLKIANKDSPELLKRHGTLTEKFQSMFGEGGSEIYVDNMDSSAKSEVSIDEAVKMESNNEDFRKIMATNEDSTKDEIYPNNTTLISTENSLRKISNIIRVDSNSATIDLGEEGLLSSL